MAVSNSSAGYVPVESPSASSKAVAKNKKKNASYKSDGVQDNDPFLLPGTDYQITLVLTVLAAAVRLFRIYQPSSVVFDEVQYVPASLVLPTRAIFADQTSLHTASVASRRNTSRGSSSWTFTRRWPRCLSH